jgi:AraC-like DNA-binding protein
MPEESWGLRGEFLIEYLLEHGVAVDEMATLLGREIGDAERNFLPIDDYLLLFGWSAERLSAPHIGLDIAEQLSTRDIGIFGYLIRNSPTVAAFCDAVVRYQPLFMRGMEFSFRKLGREFEIRWQIFRPQSESVRHDVELTLAGFVQLIQEGLGESLHPNKTLFSHACREPLERYRRTFGVEVFFEQEQNCLIFGAELLEMPLSRSDPKLLAILKQQADVSLQKWETGETLAEQTRFHIATTLESEETGAESLAGKLYITPRTLNRRLKQEGTNYQQLRQDVIVELAKRSLAETDASITAIGLKLGYSESSAFVRAFKRMTGATPANYRNMVRGE